MQITRSILLVILLLLPGLMKSQTEVSSLNYKFRRVSPEGGLEYNGQRDARQDKWGFVWVITVNDIFRFDGYTFKRYTGRLPDGGTNHIWQLNQLEIDAADNLYVAARNGLLRYDPNYDNFECIYNSSIHCLYEDTKQRLWLSANTIGYFDRKKNEFIPFRISGGENEQVSVIYESQYGLFIGTQSGRLYLLNETLKEFQPFPVETGQGIIDVVHYNSYMYVLTEAEGLFVINMNDQQVLKHYTFFYPDNDRRILARDLHIDRTGGIWISTQRGIYLLDPLSEQYSRFQYSQSDFYGLPSNSIWKISENAQGNLWIGSYSGGLSFLSFDDKNTFQSYNPITSALSFSVVSSFAEQDPYLWVGTEGGGLNRYHKQTGEFTCFSHRTGANSPAYDNISSLQLVGDKLWIAMPRSGMDCLDTRTGHFTHYRHSADENSPANDHISKIVSDGQGRLWMIYLDSPLSMSHYAVEENKFKHYYYSTGRESDGWEYGTVNDICMGNGDTLWVATTKLHAMNVKTGKVTTFQPSAEANEVTFPIDIQAIMYHPRTGDVWIGTRGQGLLRINASDRQYKVEARLSEFDVYSISSMQWDDNGYIWLGTDNGLFRYSPTDRQLLQFNKTDGTQGKIYYRNAAYRMESGLLCFGGNEGFTLVNPQLVARNSYAPEVIISELMINNQPVTPTTPDSPLSGPVFSMDNVVLGYSQNNFGFEYSSTNYLNPEKNRFRYRLRGYDNDWIETDARHRIVSYSKVPWGKYTFEILTANNEGVWGPQKNINITVKAPLWATTWAIIGYILLAAIIIVSMLRYYYERRKLKMQLYLEEHEREQKEEYHQAQLRFFTNVSHDFRTPLSLIMAAYDSLKAGRTSTKYMDIIGNNIKRLHELVNELLDFRALQNGKMRLNPAPANWNRVLEACCVDFFEYAGQRNINFINQFDETIPHNLLFDAKVVEKIVLNLLNNAFKYISTGGKITVRTLSDSSHFQSSHPYSMVQQAADANTRETAATVEVTLVVSDNGIGISEASIAKVFERYYRVNDITDEQHIGSGIGLALVKSLVELHGGTISIYSERNKGTDFVVSFRFPLAEATEKNSTVTSTLNEDASDFIQYKENVIEEVDEMVTADVIDESIYPVYTDKKTILLVEDNEDLRLLIAEILEKDYHIIQAGNGAAALEKLNDENPDLILTDVMMPLVGGIELCRAVKQNIETSHIPVIMLTAKSGMENQIEGMEGGADLYIEKPVNRKLLLLSIANIFAHQERVRTYYSKNFFSDNPEAKFSKRDSEFMVALQNEIEKQIADPELDVEKLAASLAISRSKLYTKIKTLTGKSIVEYIRSYRLRKIARMLLEENLPINLIIEQAGIDNPSYFSRIFKKEFGMTPTEFMEKNRKN